MINVRCNLCGFVPGRTGGAQVFLEGLLPELASFDDLNLSVCGSQLTEEWIKSIVPQNIEFKEVGGNSPGIVNRFLAIRKLRSLCGDGEIVWSPLNQGVGGLSTAKEVLTIHDLIPLHYSESRTEYSNNLKRRITFAARWKNSIRTARQAAAVVTVSDSNVDELQEAIGAKSPKVYGAPNGIDSGKQKAAIEKPWQYTGKPEVLAVTSGSLPHKGIGTLEKVAESMPDVTFRIVGKGSGASQPNILHTGRLSEAELNDLYRNSSALFFPSRIEGFGLPVLEATVFGMPVVATDIPVLREVGGPDSLYFPLDDIQTAVAHLRCVIESQEKAETISTRSRSYSKDFTWANSASIYRQVFRAVAT